MRMLKFLLCSTYTENNLSQHAEVWLLGNHKLKVSLGYIARPRERRRGRFEIV